jgi:hypothetical protein
LKRVNLEDFNDDEAEVEDLMAMIQDTLMERGEEILID